MTTQASPSRSRFYIILFFALALFFSGIYGLKWYQGMQAAEAMAHTPPMYQSISSAKTVTATWHPHVASVASLKSSNGVDVSAQIGGRVKEIHFKSGQWIKKGDEMIRLDDAAEVEQLNNYLATLKMNQLTLKRKKQMLHAGSISKEDYDLAKAAYDVALANVNMEQAQIGYKHVRAPFSGRVGIRKVNVGQYLQPGAVIANLQTLQPIYADFNLPEQYFTQVKAGELVSLTVASMPGNVFHGKVMAKAAAVNKTSRNFTVRARFANKGSLLQPGMFASVDLELGGAKSVVMMPRTSVVYTLYGNHVYTLTAAGKDQQGKLYKVKQVPVELGEVVGSQVIVQSGLKAGVEVVASGQLKVFNGSTVRVNNSVKLKALKDSHLTES